MNDIDPIRTALDDYDAAVDDRNAAHFASARNAAYRHGFNSPVVTAAVVQVETAHRNLRDALNDAGSMIAGVDR